MSGFSAEPEALRRLADAFRGVVALGIPQISTAPTGHPDLDSAIDDLRAAIGALTAGVDDAASTQATKVGLAAVSYVETDGALDRLSLAR